MSGERLERVLLIDHPPDESQALADTLMEYFPHHAPQVKVLGRRLAVLVTTNFQEYDRMCFFKHGFQEGWKKKIW